MNVKQLYSVTLTESLMETLSRDWRSSNFVKNAKISTQLRQYDGSFGEESTGSPWSVKVNRVPEHKRQTVKVWVHVWLMQEVKEQRNFTTCHRDFWLTVRHERGQNEFFVTRATSEEFLFHSGPSGMFPYVCSGKMTRNALLFPGGTRYARTW